MSLRVVFSPIRLGTVEVPNRVARAAHSAGYMFREVTDQFIAYHLERAKGGCGLTILEAGTVHPSSIVEMAVFDDAIVPGYRRLMEAIRPHGMKVFQQLWHGGNLRNGLNGPPLAVSAIPGFKGIVGRPATEDDIEELIAAFASAAIRCRDGGLDGVELHAAHGYLIAQFLSPLYNNRTDSYGGSFTNRLRFLRRILESIRVAVGRDYPLGIRLSESIAPGGLSAEDNNQVLRALQADHLIDFVDVSLGDHYRMDTMVSGMHSPTGYEIPSAKRILDGATVPRIVGGRFRTLEEVELVLREGTADLVSMVRAQIADPALVRKTRDGHVDLVRPCIACNQGCVGGAVRTGRLGCTVNPAVGFEQTMSERLIERTSSPLSVLIVGGGPAGMEAARIAALSGHRVTLAEATANLGGAVNVARRGPRLHTLGDITAWLEQEVYRLNVDVRLGTYVDAGDVRREPWDALIVATGSSPRMDGVQAGNPGEPALGVGLPHVLSSVDLLSGERRQLGKRALVLDSVGHYEALAATEFLLTEGVAVTYLTHHPSITPYVQSTWRDVAALERFYELGEFNALTRHHLVEIRRNECVVRPSQANKNQVKVVAADTVVLITHNNPQQTLYDELRKDIGRVVLIGDALAPRDVQLAIADGHRAARGLADVAHRVSSAALR
jgi:2,4-dienoyl-CoA reductase-like NADH-dependent reductase (Old Yellow Enzyme family)